jgi:hypothetical protein
MCRRGRSETEVMPKAVSRENAFVCLERLSVWGYCRRSNMGGAGMGRRICMHRLGQVAICAYVQMCKHDEGLREVERAEGKFGRDTHAFSFGGAPFGFGCEGVRVLYHALDM